MEHPYNDLMYCNWGKTALSEEEGNEKYHLLVYHCMDVAAVGQVILKQDKLLLNRFAEITSLSREYILPLITFYLAMHDLGKFSERFQNLRPDLSEALRGSSSDKNYVRHDIMGFSLWKEIWSKFWEGNWLYLDPSEDKYDWQDVMKPWFQSVTGHHGKPPSLHLHGIPVNSKNLFAEDDMEMVFSFVEEIAELLMDNKPKSALIKFNDDMEDSFKNTSWILAGLAVLSDWIGSNQDYFSFCSEPMPLEEYWNRYALPQAKLAVSKVGILPSNVSDDTGMGTLFPDILTPSPLQSHVSSCDLEEGAQLFILEESTGTGKTEAALTLAHRLMAKGLAEGIFIALPTMATANAMYDRLAESYGKMFSENERPSLILAHSARHLSARFRNSIGLEDQHSNSSHINNEETASAQCSAWLADSRKKALLADVGVGTIDQALISVLPAHHQSLRLLGLSKDVLIVDEVHAYDPYMHALLCTLLRFQAALGGSAILLSATLPQKHREELVESFSKGLGIKSDKLHSNRYPLVTQITPQSASEVALNAREGTKRTVDVEFFEEVSLVEEKILEISEKGGCTCWVRNTVDDAIDAYNILSSKLGSDKVHLFHARFAMGDRLEIENQVLCLFGKKSTPVIREGQILVATQVVEQSLDLDFDYMVNDLAPIDLIIQRAGRLHRHNRKERGMCDTPVLGVFSPSLTENPGANWYSEVFPKAAYVYPSHGQLWKTAYMLKESRKFTVPDDARYLIENVFGDINDIEVPLVLEDRDDEVAGEANAKISIAYLNGLNVTDGYKATFDKWLDDVITPTRLDEPSTTVRLARWDGNKITPWIESGRFSWELSQLSVSLKKVRYMVEFEGALKTAVDNALDSMKDKGKWCVLVPLSVTEGAEWKGCAKDESGREVELIYHPVTGLSVSSKR